MSAVVWVIVQRRSETYGHGDFGTMWRLPRTGPYDSGPFHPAFETAEAAAAYINGLGISGTGYEAERLEVTGERSKA